MLQCPEKKCFHSSFIMAEASRTVRATFFGGPGFFCQMIEPMKSKPMAQAWQTTSACRGMTR
jgi:hypothetical protein